MQSQEVQKCVCSFQRHYDQSSTISRANWWLHDSPGTWGGLSCSHDLYSCSQLSNYCSAAAHCNWYLVAPAAENNPNLFKHSSIFNYEWLHNKLNPGKQSWKEFQNTIIRRQQNVDMDRTFYTVHTQYRSGNIRQGKYIFEPVLNTLLASFPKISRSWHGNCLFVLPSPMLCWGSTMSDSGVKLAKWGPLAWWRGRY